MLYTRSIRDACLMYPLCLLSPLPALAALDTAEVCKGAAADLCIRLGLKALHRSTPAKPRCESAAFVYSVLSILSCSDYATLFLSFV